MLKGEGGGLYGDACRSRKRTCFYASLVHDDRCISLHAVDEGLLYVAKISCNQLLLND